MSTETVAAECELLRYWLLRAHHGRFRQGWEAGPTEGETFADIRDVLANLGIEPGSAEAEAILAKQPWFSPAPAAAPTPTGALPDAVLLRADTRAPFPINCTACGKPLLIANLFVDDGCPCNSPRGVNFEPRRCERCRVNNCVKPGHRLQALFGVATVPLAPHPDDVTLMTSPGPCQACGSDTRRVVCANGHNVSYSNLNSLCTAAIALEEDYRAAQSAPTGALPELRERWSGGLAGEPPSQVIDRPAATTGALGREAREERAFWEMLTDDAEPAATPAAPQGGQAPTGAPADESETQS